jgi:hypothetical protein
VNPAYAQSRDRRAAQVFDLDVPQDIIWQVEQDTSACAKRPIWTLRIQPTNLLVRTPNFDYQPPIPIRLRGDGTASMDREIQPGRNVRYRVSGSFDGKGRLFLRLEDVARDDIRCSWKFSAWYKEGVVSGVKGGWSGTP